MFLTIAATILAGYLLGSINTAIIVSKCTTGRDIRKYGSGNAGATNTMRALGIKKAVVVLLFDVLKGVAAVIIGMAIMGDDGRYLAGLASIVGHIFPLYYGFKGGKGVSTAAAVMICWNIYLFAAAIAVFAVVLLASKMVSLASICAAASFIFYSIFFARLPLHVVCGVTAAVLIIAMHWQNISRIINRTENKVNLRRKKGIKETRE